MQIEWIENKVGSYDVAWNEAHSLKDKGWRLPSPEELIDAAGKKTPGFTNDKYYWTNDWNSDPIHAGAVKMYYGAYFIGIPTFQQCNYRFIRIT